GCLLLRDRGWRQSEQSQQCRTHSKGRFHHTPLRENSAQRMRPRGHSASEKETAALAAAMWSAAPDRQRDDCSLFVLTVSRTKSEQRNRKRRRHGAPPSDGLQADLLPRRQWAVSVEESASTAGSVVTEVSVGLAFSSSHSIGSGLRVSARASTSSMRETGTMSRPFLMLSLISTTSLAFSSRVSTVFMPPPAAP